MTSADLTALRRLIDEHKAGFPVERDPWQLCEELLDECELWHARRHAWDDVVSAAENLKDALDRLP